MVVFKESPLHWQLFPVSSRPRFASVTVTINGEEVAAGRQRLCMLLNSFCWLLLLRLIREWCQLPLPPFFSRRLASRQVVHFLPWTCRCLLLLSLRWFGSSVNCFSHLSSFAVWLRFKPFTVLSWTCCCCCRCPPSQSSSPPSTSRLLPFMNFLLSTVCCCWLVCISGLCLESGTGMNFKIIALHRYIFFILACACFSSVH